MPSPAEMMFGRRIQCNLPVRVTSPAPDEQHETRENNSQRSEQRYNWSSKDLTELNIDDQIFYQDVAKRTWSPGVIIGVGPEPRSYTLKCATTGRTLRRNRQLVRPRKVEVHIPETPEMTSYHEDTRITPDPEPTTIATATLPAVITTNPPVKEAAVSDQTPKPRTPTKVYKTCSGRTSRPPQRPIANTD